MTTGPTTPQPGQGGGRALRVVAPPRATPIDPVAELERIRGENETLYAVITTVSSSLDLGHVLDGIVEIATEATDCHACFVYFVEGERLVLRAASPMYRFFVGKLAMGLDEGLTGWVARNGTPEFIRDQALSDPRMKYMSELEEERFQSMVAVPISAKSGDVIGVIVLHTAAPREFEEEVLNFLVHTASLVGGAIENAQLFQGARRRVEALTALARLSQRLAAVTEPGDLHAAVTEGVRHLLGVDACHLYRLVPERDELHLAASEPESAPAPAPRVRGTGLLFDLLRREGPTSSAAEGDRVVRALWPAGEDGAVLVTPLVVSDERLGILCAYSAEAREFDVEEVELFRSVANQAAVGLKKGELIERLTAENTVKDLFAALSEGVTEVADAKAAAAGFDLTRPHLFLEGRPDRAGDPAWAEVSAALETAARSALPSAVFDAGSDSLRAIVPMPDNDDEGPEGLRRILDEIAVSAGAIVGLGSAARGAREGRRGLQQAADAARIGRVLRPSGGAVAYEQLGAYRYLVHLDLDHTPQDRYWKAIELLTDYDRRRQSHLLETLEQYLLDRRSMAASARALFIHPNTLRQRLDRIEKLSGLDIAEEDLLSLELAIKLVRLRQAQ